MRRAWVQMSEALIRGFIASGICAPEDVIASVRSTARWQAMESLGVQPVGDALRGGAAEVAARSDTILLGVCTSQVLLVQASASPSLASGLASQIGGAWPASCCWLMCKEGQSTLTCPPHEANPGRAAAPQATGLQSWLPDSLLLNRSSLRWWMACWTR